MEDENLGCLVMLPYTIITAFTGSLAYGLLLKMYWVWFAIPIASSFGYVLSPITFAVCFALSYSVGVITKPLVLLSIRSQIGGGMRLEDAVNGAIFPYIYSSFALFLGYFIKTICF